MFLISWRGYWQELIESGARAHPPLANLVRWYAQADVSIVRRLVGLAHFTVGYYTPLRRLLINFNCWVSSVRSPEPAESSSVVGYLKQILLPTGRILR